MVSCPNTREPVGFLPYGRATDMRTINTLFLTGSHFCPDEQELATLASLYPQVNVTSVGMLAYTSRHIEQAQIVVGLPKPEDLKLAANLR